MLRCLSYLRAMCMLRLACMNSASMIPDSQAYFESITSLVVSQKTKSNSIGHNEGKYQQSVLNVMNCKEEYEHSVFNVINCKHWHPSTFKFCNSEIYFRFAIGNDGKP